MIQLPLRAGQAKSFEAGNTGTTNSAIRRGSESPQEDERVMERWEKLCEDGERVMERWEKLCEDGERVMERWEKL